MTSRLGLSPALESSLESHKVSHIPAQSLWPDGTGLVWLEQGGYEISLALRFRVSQAAKFAGAKWYRNAVENPFYVVKLIASDLTLLGMWAFVGDAGPFESGGSWVNFWAHPRVPLSADTEYVVSIYCNQAGFWGEIGGMLGGDVVSGIITAPEHTSESPNMAYRTGDVGWTSFVSSGGVRFGLDVLVEPLPA